MPTRYRFEPDQSRFTARVYPTGLLAFLGHSPTFAVRRFGGAVEFPDELVANLRLELLIGATGLSMTGDVDPADRQAIEGRVRGDVLDTAAFPEIAFRAAAEATEKLAAGRFRVALGGSLELRGAVRPHRAEAELAMFGDGLRLRGETGVRLSAFGIAPVTILGGTVQIRDEVTLSFDLLAVPDQA